MSLTTSQLATLRTELLTDPQALGYNASQRNDTAMANEVNFIRDGTTPCPDNNVVGAAITVNRNDVTSGEIIDAISATDWAALSTLQSQQLQLLASMKSIDCTRNNLRANVISIFPVGGGSHAPIAALTHRFGSRGEQLFGVGIRVTIDDVGKALN